MKISEFEATGQPVCVGYGVLSVNHERPVTAGSICISALTQGVREKRGMPKTQREHRAVARGSPGCCSVMQRDWSRTR